MINIQFWYIVNLRHKEGDWLKLKKKCNPLNCKSLFSFHIAVSYQKNNLTGISTYELNDKYTDLIL